MAEKTESEENPPPAGEGPADSAKTTEETSAAKPDEQADTAGSGKTAGAEGEEAPAAAKEEDDDRGKRVYVGNLAWEVSWQDLKDYMKTTGLDVVRTSIMTTPDGRSKGCGIAEFNSAEDAAQAVSDFNDTELYGRQIFVREDREDRSAIGGARGNPMSRGPGGHTFSTGDDAKNRRVYVGNLSWDVAWQDLKDHMRQAGEVVHAEIITEYNGRSKGCGIVEFATNDDAQNAIKDLTDTELKGRMIFVREDRETTSQAPQARAQNTSVYVWNLAPETSWQDLKDHMRKAGNVDSATILTNAAGESVGCGVVVYQKPQEAMRAIRELQNSELNGRRMNAREDREAGRGGGGGRAFGGRGRAFGGRGRGHGGIRGRGGMPEGVTLYVSNLAPGCTWKELKDHFRQAGDVRRAEVVAGHGGPPSNYGKVEFFTKEDADKALERLNGSDLMGSSLEVRPKNR